MNEFNEALLWEAIKGRDLERTLELMYGDAELFKKDFLHEWEKEQMEE